jgi:hypothetical protein
MSHFGHGGDSKVPGDGAYSIRGLADPKPRAWWSELRHTASDGVDIFQPVGPGWPYRSLIFNN